MAGEHALIRAVRRGGGGRGSPPPPPFGVKKKIPLLTWVDGPLQPPFFQRYIKNRRRPPPPPNFQKSTYGHADE